MDGRGEPAEINGTRRLGDRLWPQDAWARRGRWSARDIAGLGMLLALDHALHVFEAQLPTLPIPGAKIGWPTSSRSLRLYAWGFWRSPPHRGHEADRRFAGDRHPLCPGLRLWYGRAVFERHRHGRAASLRRASPGPGGREPGGRDGPTTSDSSWWPGRCWASPKSFSTCPYLLWFAVPSGALVGVTATKLLSLAGNCSGQHLKKPWQSFAGWNKPKVIAGPRWVTSSRARRHGPRHRLGV